MFCHLLMGVAFLCFPNRQTLIVYSVLEMKEALVNSQILFQLTSKACKASKHLSFKRIIIYIEILLC